MTVRYERARNVLWRADELRELRPVFNLPVRRLALRHVFEQEGIIVTRAAIRSRAYVDGGDGTYIITVRNDLDGTHLTKVLLHEYAHIHLHMHGEDEGVTRQLFPCRPGDVREAEADLLAAALWYGEEATPDFAPIAKLMARVDAVRLVRPVMLPPQLSLGIPAGVPMYKGPAGPAFDGLGSFNNLAHEPRRPKNRHKGPRIKVGDSHDSLLFDWSKEGKPLGYFHPHLGWMDVWDTMPDPSGKEGKREILVCGDRRAQWRDFIITTRDRRRYTFAEGERRKRSPKDLNKQIENSTRVPTAAPITAQLLFRAARAPYQPKPENEE